MLKRIAFVALALYAPACGGGGGSPSAPSPLSAPQPVPGAAITARGGGPLIIHPSASPIFAVALAAPIRIQETAGGTADWNYGRLSLLRRGVEIERSELTAVDIRAAGFGRIGANSNEVYRVVFRLNSDDFDDFAIVLGFTDIRDGRQFTVSVDADTFTDVQVSPTPQRAP